MTITLPINSIQSAINAKAPVVGIPVPDHAPVRLLRSRLKTTLKALTITSAEYQDGNLKVTAQAARIKAVRTFYPMARNEASKLLEKWTKSERVKMSKPKPSSPAEKQLQQLRAKLDKLTYRPKNPAIAGGITFPSTNANSF